MPANPPLTASGPRDPAKCPRPLPRNVRDMIVFMVRGDPNDEEGKPLDFVTAGRLAGLAPDLARRYLDRGNFRVALRAERKAFRMALNAGNELALARIRDGENAMAAVRSIQLLEQIDDSETRAPGAPTAPGFAIVIQQVVQQAGAQPLSSAPVIDGTVRAVD